MLSPTFVNDGDYGTEVQVEPTQPTYPFGNDPTPDVFAQIHDRMMEIALSAFAPRIAARTSYTNLLPRSNNFAAGEWSKSNLTVNTAVIQNPWDGSQTVDQLLDDTSTGLHYLAGNATLTANSHILWGIFAAGALSWVYLRCVDFTTGNDVIVYFDLTGGKVGSTSGVSFSSASIKPVGNGYFLCQAVFNCPAGAAGIYCTTATANGGISHVGTGGGIFCAQLQLERAITPGPVIITAAVSRSVSIPDVDADDRFSYLVAESKPQASDGEIARFSRTFARIPADQVKPGSINFPRPVLHDIKNGTAYAVAFEEDQRLSWIFTSRKTVSSLTAPVVADDVETNTKALLPGGITINLAGSNGSTGTTGSFNTSDSISTIQTAVFNIWTHAVVVVTKDAYGIYCKSTYSGTGGGAITQVDGTASSAIAVNGTPDDFSITASASGKTISTPLDDSIRNVHAVAHGGVVGDRVALWRGDKLIAMGSVVTVPGADDFTVELDSIPGKNEVVTHCGFSTDAAMCVVNGPKMCDVRHTTRFYLPGYTPGITTDADIPKQAPQVDPISWLGVIIAGTAWPVYQVNEVSQWMGSILQQETITLQLADAVDTVTP